MRPVAQPPHCQCRGSKRSKAKSHLFLRSFVNLQRWKRNLKSRTCLWSVGRSNSIYAPSLHTTYLQPCSAWSGFQQQGPIQGLLIHIRVFVATCSSDFQNSFHDPDPHFFEVQFSFQYVVSNIAIHMKTRLHLSKYYCKSQLVPHLRMVNTMLGLGERVKRVGE